MQQQPLPGMEPDNRIVNVASVPQRSPFRYPGGKTWLVPTIRAWLAHCQPTTLVEPFAGGAIVGLTAAFEELAADVILTERDEQVAAVWQTILAEGPWLADRILAFDLKPETVANLLSQPADSVREVAFQTIVKNRVNRGGILAAGAGRIKSGEAGRGMASRWYPRTLARRIHDIVRIKDRISFVAGDGLAVIREYKGDPDATFFVDPPYTASGKRPGSRLYDHWQIDHEALFGLMREVRGDFLMTYDDDEYVRKLAAEHGFQVVPVAMKNTHHAHKSELLIGPDLQWFGGC